jgi:hypothetical protein
MKNPPPLPLEDRIAELHVELNALIDARVAELKKQLPNQPEVGLRRDIESLAWNCPCRQYKAVAEGRR